jgi:hypothetical protein
MAEAKKTPAQMAAETVVETPAVVEEVKAVPEKKAEKPKRPRVQIIIPEDPLNPGNKQWWCCINGQEYYVQRGVPVEVSAGVAELYNNTVKREQENRTKVKVTQFGQG